MSPADAQAHLRYRKFRHRSTNAASEGGRSLNGGGRVGRFVVSDDALRERLDSPLTADGNEASGVPCSRQTFGEHDSRVTHERVRATVSLWS